MSRIYAVVLIYNSKIEESITCKGLKEIKDNDIDVIILDNSTRDMNNASIAMKYKYHYLNMNGNKGISYPYNKAIDYIFNNLDYSYDDYIVWLDDDTGISADYFNVLKQEIKKNKEVDIFAPIVYGQDGVIYSPNESRYIKNKLVSTEEETFHIQK